MKTKSYGERLQWARKRAGMTQVELANISKVKQGTISKIERGDQSESAFDTILAFHLKINPHWLTTGVGEPDGWIDLSQNDEKGKNLFKLANEIEDFSRAEFSELLAQIDLIKRRKRGEL